MTNVSFPAMSVPVGTTFGSAFAHRAPDVTSAPSQDALEAAREFEAMFLTQSFEQSFKTLPDSAFGGGHAGETWRHFLAKSIADEVAAGGGSGLADWLAPQIARAQEAAQATAKVSGDTR